MERKPFPRKSEVCMVTVNGEKRNAIGQNLLEFLKTEGYVPERVVVERNL